MIGSRIRNVIHYCDDVKYGGRKCDGRIYLAEKRVGGWLAVMAVGFAAMASHDSLPGFGPKPINITLTFH